MEAQIFYLKKDVEKTLPLTREQFNALVSNKKSLLGDIEGSKGEYASWDADCFFNYYYADGTPPKMTDDERKKVIKIWEL